MNSCHWSWSYSHVDDENDDDDDNDDEDFLYGSRMRKILSNGQFKWEQDGWVVVIQQSPHTAILTQNIFCYFPSAACVIKSTDKIVPPNKQTTNPTNKCTF